MRTTFSTVALLASSLLTREVFAAPHVHKHKRAVVTDTVIVMDEIVVTDDNGTYETGLPVPISTTTINGIPVVVSSTPTASTSSTQSPATQAPATSVAQPASTSSESPTSAAVFIQEPSKTKTKTTAEPPTTSAPAVVSTTSSPVETPTTLATRTSSTPPASTSSTSSSSGKRGLAYNNADLLSGFVTSASASIVTWAYNWASSTSTIPSSLEFVPILWGMQDEFTSVWKTNADAALAAGSTHVMSFNEPDYSGQANLAVSAAVSGYLEYVQPYASKAKIGTPAVTNGGSSPSGPMGTDYLGNFTTALTKAKGTYDFCAVHWYDSATNIDYFKSFMETAIGKCNGKPVWLTEFGASGSSDEQNTFLETVMPWMDEQDQIERYAYFMVAVDNLISTGTTLSQLGTTFATFK